MMTLDGLYDFVLDKAKLIGMVPVNMGLDIVRPDGNTVVRNNLRFVTFQTAEVYVGLTRAEERSRGPYFDFSFVIFPDKDLNACVVTLCVGSLGFRNDLDIATSNEARNAFAELMADDAPTFLKDSFSDLVSPTAELQSYVDSNCQQLSKIIERYNPFISAAVVVDFAKSEKTALETICKWLSVYGKLRNWHI